MQKTDITKSPLLTPVIERDYTKGLTVDTGTQTATIEASTEQKQSQPTQQQQSQTQPKPDAGQKFNIPSDETKEFSFEDIPESPSDVGAEDHAEGIGISGASAKSFANFAGDAIQMYLPKMTYGYCKIDIENVIVNIESGNLTNNWLEAFTTINERTEEALQISDDAIKMWKKAFKDYLESENIAFANPKTAFLLATVVLLADQGVKAYQIRKANEDYMRQALEKSNPGEFQYKKKEPVTPQENGAKKAA